MLLGEGLFDPHGSSGDQLVQSTKVLWRTRADERFGADSCTHRDFFPGLAEGVELLVIGERGEGFELASVDPPSGIVVLTLVR